MNKFETLLSAIAPIKVINETVGFPIDLSDSSPLLKQRKPSAADDFEDFIEGYLVKNNAQFAFGGYNEMRNLYQRSAIFNDSESEERNIHIGLDLWIAAGTPVLAALDGTVHSFDYNAGLGNYGPTIILEHSVDAQQFYTLYGHLSMESIEEIEIGDVYRKGQQLATLGDASVNGDYAPHLHFQIIKDVENWFGDYPGVCGKNDLDFYLENCPDPNLLLKLKAQK